MNPHRLLLVAGARPNFMKVAPLLRAAGADAAFDARLVHTGQHYDEHMSGAFFRDLGIPAPAHHLEAGSGTHAVQTAEILRRFEPVLDQENPGAVVVAGDVNSTLACALAAAKKQIPVIHVEAGLRSFDRSMPEEINRLATDAISDLLLASEESAVENLRREGVPDHRIAFVGNLMIDSLAAHREAARALNTALRLELPEKYGLVTLHRPANVDRPEALAPIIRALEQIGGDLPLVFPVHPRTRARLDPLRPLRNIRLLDPLGYLEFLALHDGARAIFTDSGGIQEESTILGIPCFTLRDNTERPATIAEGTNRLAGTTKESILAAWKGRSLVRRDRLRKPTGWDGHAAPRAVEAIRRFLTKSQVPLRRAA